MELTIQTPALLFPALSFLLLAFTNKFLAIANLIRKLIQDNEDKQHHTLMQQISTLKRRLVLIRWMQAFGVGGILSCVITMFMITFGVHWCAKVMFVISLLMTMTSLVLSLIEIFLSAGALRVLLRDLEEKQKL